MGVGCIPRDQDEPLTLVRGAKGSRGDNIISPHVAARGKAGGELVEPSGLESDDVLHDHVSRSSLSDEPEEVIGETAPVSAETSSAAGDAEILAGRPAKEDIGAAA
ncbi:MAG TPA: hypothetical protein VFH61_08475 [Thermoleophilia bacterium]|nr:hypothetical protein [Thermoleophilia bacterium]